MSTTEPIIKIEAAANGFVVCIYDPPPNQKDPYAVPYDMRYRSFVADDLSDVLALVEEWAPKAAKKANPKSDFDYAYKEIAESEDRD